MFGLDKNLINSVRIETVAEYDRFRKATEMDVEIIRNCFEEKSIGCTVSNVPKNWWESGIHSYPDAEEYVWRRDEENYKLHGGTREMCVFCE